MIQPPKQYEKFINVRKQYVKPLPGSSLHEQSTIKSSKIDEAKERRDACAMKTQMIQVFGEHLLVEPSLEH